MVRLVNVFFVPIYSCFNLKREVVPTENVRVAILEKKIELAKLENDANLLSNLEMQLENVLKVAYFI